MVCHTAVYVGLMMLLTTLSLIMTVLVLRLYHREESPPPSQQLLSFIQSLDRLCLGASVATRNLIKVAEYLGGRNSPKVDSQNQPERFTEDTQKNKQDINNWKYVAKVLDKACLTFFLLIYFISTIGLMSVTYRSEAPVTGDVCQDWVDI